MYYKETYQSPVGIMTMASDGTNLIGLWNEGQKYHGDTLFKNMVDGNDLPVFQIIREWLDSYFAGQNPSISKLPLSTIGSEFRKKVWAILCEIPYGKVITYGDIARKLATERNLKSMSAQAVGGAVGHNPISVIIPCHRVVGSNGSLTGYAAGIQTKIKLLELEGVDTSQFFIPKRGTAL